MGGVESKPFLEAACNGDDAKIASLLQKGVSVHEEDNSGNTALYYAAIHGRTRVIAQLLDAGAMINKKNVIRSTPLHAAVERGQVEAVKLLLERGASVKEVNKKGKTPLDLVPMFKGEEITKLLRAHRRRQNEKQHRESLLTSSIIKQPKETSTSKEKTSNATNTPHQVVKDEAKSIPSVQTNNHISDQMVASILGTKSKPLIDQADENGNTVLHLAARSGDIDAVKTLIARGFSIDKSNKWGNTPLQYAANDGHTDVVGLLLNAGAAIDGKDKNDHTALHLAAMWGHTDTAKLLVSQGASVQLKNNGAKTALDFADKYGYAEIVQLLRDRTPKNGIVFARPESSSLLHAAGTGNDTMVTNLLKQGLSVDEEDDFGNTALHRAAITGHDHIVGMLLNAGASIDRKNRDGCTALYAAVAYGHLDTVKILITRGAFAQIENNLGETPLHAVASERDVGIVGLLLNAGVEIDKKSKTGNTALHLAAIRGHAHIVKMLIMRGASVQEVNYDGRTALHYAIEYGHAQVVQLLQNVVMFNESMMVGRRDESTDSDSISVPFGIQKSQAPKVAGTFGCFGKRESDARTLSSSITSSEDGCGPLRMMDLSNRDSHALKVGSSSVGQVRSYSPEHAPPSYSEVVNQPEIRSAGLSDGSERDFLAMNSTPPPYKPFRESSIQNEKNGLHALEFYIINELNRTIPNVIADVRGWCRYMIESESMCLHLCDRFMAIYEQLRHVDCQEQASPLRKYTRLIARYHDFLQRNMKQSLVVRLVCSNKVTNHVLHFHRELDRVLVLLELENVRALQASPEQWDRDRNEQLAVFKNRVYHNQHTIANEFRDASSQIEALTILRFERPKCRRTDTKWQIQLIDSLDQQIASISNASVPIIEPWFIPPYHVECEEEQFSRGAFGSVHHAKLLNSKVVVKRVLIDEDAARDAFMKEVKIWHQLSHPHVIKLHGACHLRRPFFVCEYAANGTLPQFLAPPQNRHLTWQKLYELALGLQYLHEKNIIHGDLKGNNLLVCSDGTAKLTDFGMSYISASSISVKPQAGNGASQWKAPEILKGERISFESDIFAFAMCIVEALRGDFPYGTTTLDAVVRHHVKNGGLPERPDGVDDEQWGLISRLCAYEPADRPQIYDVVDTLAIFKEDEFNRDPITDFVQTKESFSASSNNSDASYMLGTAAGLSIQDSTRSFYASMPLSNSGKQRVMALSDQNNRVSSGDQPRSSELGYPMRYG